MSYQLASPQPIHAASRRDHRKVLTGGCCKQVSFLNAHCVNVAQHDPGYRSSLRKSDLVPAECWSAGEDPRGRIGNPLLRVAESPSPYLT